MTGATHWRLQGDRVLALEPFALMGILNVTPDSFSDGGRYEDHQAALRRAIEMVRGGAAMIDVGAESTRPGAEPVSDAEQIARALPVVRALATEGIAVSIDTRSAVVAEAALECGAVAVNDVSAASDDPRMLSVAARRGAAIVLMHRLRRPEEDAYSDRYAESDRPRYADVVRAVAEHLHARREAAINAGIDPARVAIDPGLGFGKTVDQNYALIARLDELARLGAPVLVGASRKSFLGAASGETVAAARSIESVAAATAAYLRGARLFRVHDVQETRRALAVAQRVTGGVGH